MNRAKRAIACAELAALIASRIACARERILICSPVLTSGPILGALSDVLGRGTVPVTGVIDRTQMQVDDRIVNLSPGMAATVEIKTGSRSILSYLLSPLLRYRQETMHER